MKNCEIQLQTDISENIYENKNLCFQHLAPQDNCFDEAFFKAFDYALSKEEIKNIAITGTYGSGKSSLLQSYQKSYSECKRCNKKYAYCFKYKVGIENKDINFLNISLATFACEKIEDSNLNKQSNTVISPETEKEQENSIPGKKTHETNKFGIKSKRKKETFYELSPYIEQKLEKSILQQMFFKESYNRFPFSRINRIKNIPRWKIILIEITIITLILFGLYLSNIDNENLLLYFFNRCFHNNVLSGFFSTLGLCSFCVLGYKIIEFFLKIRIGKFGFQNINIEFSSDEKESLINRYLDEVLYFFESTKYNVVIFEDLDRFQNTEIFPKLRELNTLLNNYEEIDRRIIFVYALRDEVFEDSSRTKFFDFIIPVIPVINTQNAGSMLIQKKKKLNNEIFDKLDDAFLDTIGLYINDMRLLLNCINEFFIFYERIKESFGENFDAKKLFSIILYKNLYPKDFAALYEENGYLYSIVNSKKKLIEKGLELIDKELNEINDEYEKYKQTLSLSIKELRSQYVYEAIKSISISSVHNSSYQNNTYNFDFDYTNDIYFDKLRNGSLIINEKIGNTSFKEKTFKINFEDIQNKVNPNLNYEKREEIIKNGYSFYEQQIKEKNSQKVLLNTKKLSELINNKEIVVDIFKQMENAEEINKDFLNFLLIHDYIGEDYFNYITFFYEGALTKSDREFVLQIKGHKEPNFNLELKNIENIVNNRIEDEEWNLTSILNNSLLDYLLETRSPYLEKFIQMIIKNDAEKIPDEYKQFSKQYNCPKEKKADYYNNLYKERKICSNWPEALFNNNRDIFFDFLINADIDEGDEALRNFSEKHLFFFEKDFTNEELNIIFGKLTKLDVKFSLKYPAPNNLVLDAIILNNLYTLDLDSMSLIIKHEEKNTADEIIYDYLTRIQETRNENIISYINNNYSSFVNSLIESLGTNIAESEKIFISLINDDRVSLNNKYNLIKNNQFKVTDIKQVQNISLPSSSPDINYTSWLLLLNENKIASSWHNIFVVFEYFSFSISGEIAKFLNDENNISKLQKITEKDKQGFSNDFVDKIHKAIIESTDIKEGSWIKLINLFDKEMENISTLSISKERIRLIVENKLLSVNKENYTTLLQYPEILYLYIKENIDFIIDEKDKSYYASKNIIGFLKSSICTEQESKKIILGKFDCFNSLTNEEDLSFIGAEITRNSIKENLPQYNIKQIALAMTSEYSDSIPKFIMLQNSELSPIDIRDILVSYENEYKLIFSPKGNTSKFSKSDERIEFIKFLEEHKVIGTVDYSKREIIVYKKKKMIIK